MVHRSEIEKLAVCNLIKTTRQKSDLNQFEMAKRLCISQVQLSKIEAGDFSPKLYTWNLFCREFDLFPESTRAFDGMVKKFQSQRETESLAV